MNDSHPGREQPQRLFMALPGRMEDHPASYCRCLADLLELAGADAGPDNGTRIWRSAAFVSNEDHYVRRCILPGLTLNPANHPAEFRELVTEAVHIARAHPDEYIRHRVELQV